MPQVLEYFSPQFNKSEGHFLHVCIRFAKFSCKLADRQGHSEEVKCIPAPGGKRDQEKQPLLEVE